MSTQQSSQPPSGAKDPRPSDQPGTHGEDGGEPGLKRVMGPGLLLFFIVGDIIGAGIFAITGDVAAQVGGVAWLPFLVAFAVASLTALSYLELVGRHPQAAGAALFVHKSFGIHFVTFLVAFAVVCSGITSASTSSGLVAENLLIGLREFFSGIPDDSGTATLVTALVFMTVLALINLRGVGESVWFNVVLTVVIIGALFIVIGIGAWAMVNGDGDPGRIVVFESSTDRSLFGAVTIATTIAFFAMVGFEDSINMVEEVREPRVFPQVMLTGLGFCALLYVLVAIAVVVVIPPGDVLDPVNPDAGVLLDVVRVGAPGIPIDRIFPFLTVFAVANTALINMLMASRLIYGMAKQDVLPRPLAAVLPGRRSPWVAIVFTTLLAFGLITYVRSDPDSDVVTSLAGTTGLLLLAVFSVVHVCCVVLRRRDGRSEAFRAPAWTPWVGAVVCAFLVGPWAREREDWIQYRIAGALLAIGLVLWVVTWLVNRGTRGSRTGFRDIDALEE